MKWLENIKRFFMLNEITHLYDDPKFREFLRVKKIEKKIEEKINCDLNKEEKIKLFKMSEEIAKLSFYTYFKKTFTANKPLIKGEHIELTCDILTLIETGIFECSDTISRLAMSFPPRHLKSMMASNCYPSWFMSKKPSRNTIMASYGENLIDKAGQKNREKIEQIGGRLFNVEIKKDVGAKKNWDLNTGGKFKGGTIRGGVTGEGAELLIIDDPVKNMEEAKSITIQEKIYDEYDATFLTRLHPNSVLILIMTRWHTEDLRGKIESNEKHVKWLKLDMVAVTENEEDVKNDVLGRNIGEALYPQMYGIEYFKPRMKNKRVWEALYKQKPTVGSGEYFKKQYFSYYKSEGEFFILYKKDNSKKYIKKKECWAFIVVDTAQKEKKVNDETALIVCVVTKNGDLLIHDAYHGRIDIPDQEKLLIKYWQQYEGCNFLAIEDKASGIGLLAHLSKKGIPTKAMPANTDKINRAITSVVYYESGNIYHNKDMDCLGYLESQLIAFPTAKHDDLVDCISNAGIILASHTREKTIY